MFALNQELDVELDGIFPDHTHKEHSVVFGVSSQYGGAGSGKISSTSSQTTEGATLRSGISTVARPIIVGKDYRPPSFSVNFFKRTE